MSLYLLAFTLTTCGWSQNTKPLAQDTGSWESMIGFSSGRSRKIASESHKSFFLIGYADGLKYALAMAAKLDQTTTGAASDVEIKRFRLLMRSCWPGQGVAEVQSALDHFYRTRANLPISIPSALFIIAMRAAGESADDIQKETERQRAISH